jgi:hypothetical protein
MRFALGRFRGNFRYSSPALPVVKPLDANRDEFLSHFTQPMLIQRLSLHPEFRPKSSPNPKPFNPGCLPFNVASGGCL